MAISWRAKFPSISNAAPPISASNAAGWGDLRTQANALFLRGFDREILEEMRGIADGASDAGVKWQGRRLDLVDIVVANVTVELSELRSAMTVTPTGLESFKFEPPSYYEKKRDSVLDHCSAFAATGPATRDGKMVIGHVTWWPLTLAEQTNVWIDVKPENGHRVLMQSYPGGIESGTDWYQNDAGIVLTETTIRQTPFNPQGTPVAFRARMAIQYGGSIDEVVKQLGTRNNGLYTNEWLMGDAKTNEIAMYELGTAHTKLWRSSKNEWFGDTPGFYWGNNNAKDLTIRTEYLPDPQGRPEYIPYVPQVRDLAWQNLYRGYRGQIDEQFAYLAFRTAPLVSASTMDAKVITAEMANQMMVWAAIGKPNQREWVARGGYEKNDGLYPSGYALFTTAPPNQLAEIEQARLNPKPAEPAAARTSRAARRQQFPRPSVEGMDRPRRRLRYLVRRRNHCLPRPAAIRRSGESSRSPPHSVSRPETRPRQRDEPFPHRRDQGRPLPGFPAPQVGRRQVLPSARRLVRREHHEDSKCAELPRQSRSYL